ncbi:MAG TPA: alpha/beta hydrolase [Solirubrobacteraceae bacterium]|jgi:pimeloyl-ACP methyl ester carboxylesterase|nr:alpha/beta hydrolase [Solirubrobacteraceae bacterium]
MTTESSFRGGSGPPMMLIHGFSATWRVWEPVLAPLTARHDVYAPTLLGHYGGPPYHAGDPASPSAIADQLERDMDALGWEKAHLVGNSLGGWLALELAGRGRALSTVALAPAGGWPPGGKEDRRLERMFRTNYRMIAWLGERGRQLVRRPRFRALTLRDVVARPQNISARFAAEMLEGAAACEIYLPFLEVAVKGGFGSLGDIDTPTRIAWGTADRILRYPEYARRLHELAPDAEWVEMSGLGHCPMLDDPQETVRIVLEVTEHAGAEQAQPAPAG